MGAFTLHSDSFGLTKSLRMGRWLAISSTENAPLRACDMVVDVSCTSSRMRSFSSEHIGFFIIAQVVHVEIYVSVRSTSFLFLLS